jgi:4-amino-4-deoxy-L-arabinose transferase-like glycosyltransferase
MLAPGVSFSARIMTTDVPLLFFWALALLAYVKLMRGAGWRWAIVLAAAFGFGLLSKYAMAYFVLGVLLAGIVSTDARRLLGRPLLWLALVAGLVMLTPNILWNAHNGFATATATAGYVHKALSFDEPLDFLLAQFGVAGPVTFGALLVFFAYFGSRNLDADDRAMLAFSLPPLLIIFLNAMWSGAANANWAAPALISAFVVTSGVLARARMWRLLGAGLAIGVLAQVVLVTGDTVADRLTVPLLGENADIYQRVLGWDDLGEEVAALAKSKGAASVAVERRWEESALNYYLRHEKPVYIWTGSPEPTNHFEMVYPFTADVAQPILFVTDCDRGMQFGSAFDRAVDLGPLAIDTGPTSSRTYHAYLLSGVRQPPGAPPACGG